MSIDHDALSHRFWWMTKMEKNSERWSSVVPRCRRNFTCWLCFFGVGFIVEFVVLVVLWGDVGRPTTPQEGKQGS